MATTATQNLADWVIDARNATIRLVSDLSDEQLIGPKLPTLNPLLWEIAHAAWFQEFWVLRHVAGQTPIRSDLDYLYDSIAIDHDVRWDLPLLSRSETLAYLRQVQDRVLELLCDHIPSDSISVDPFSGRQLPLNGEPVDQLSYFVKFSVFHEDMHTEAFTYTRQTLGFPAPHFPAPHYPDPDEASGPDPTFDAGPDPADRALLVADAEIPGGIYEVGGRPSETFVFDNEMWAHPVAIDTTRIARTAVTQSQFADFVDDGGYLRRELWSTQGWNWRSSCQAECPIYWKRQRNQRWLRQDFDQWIPLESDRPVIHVNWYEADAYCRWANRRLPTEAEWEIAAAIVPSQNGSRPVSQRFPWGNDPPDRRRVNMDWRTMGTVDATHHADGDSFLGCRQMIGNVWEWTSTTFQPYPGFVTGPYREYSRSCFGQCKVLRGGAWATRSRLLCNTYRNYYRPDRRDIWAGFRTCARS